MEGSGSTWSKTSNPKMVDIRGNYEFQAVIGKFIEKMGFQIDSTRILDDGSIDFKAQTLNPMGGKVLSIIRASAYARPVNENDIKDLFDAMNDMGAVRAAYITTSGFSDEAVEAAKDKPISLINKYQLMDSIEKRGLLQDKELMEALDTFGMAEQHFQGYEQSFDIGMSQGQIKSYFDGKAKKGEKPAAIMLRYAPLTVLKVVTIKEVWTEDQTLQAQEKKDYMFINLNNLDLYYVTQKRKRNTTEQLLMRSDILRKIFSLPPESKEHLINLLDHGDLPMEDLQGEELSILKNKKVIEIYEGDRAKAMELVDWALYFLEGVRETVVMIIDEILSEVSSLDSETAKKAEVEKVKKKVTAVIRMPHLYGGLYDIWKYLEALKGLRPDSEIDTINSTSKEIGRLIKSIMKGKVFAEGIIFMPYFRTKYVDEKSKVTKYEILMAPRFKSGKPTDEDEAETSAPKIKRKPLAGEYKLIR
jgi:hypothetical protein